MIAIFLAAHIAAGLAPAGQTPPLILCDSHAMQTSDIATPALLLRPQDRKDARAKKLTELPKANLEVAVERSVAGCVRPVIIRYDAEGDGSFARNPAN